MLGSLNGKLRWRWSIWGKHPSVGDYLKLGLKTRVEQAVSLWIEKGYDKLNSRRDEALVPCTWRFWTKATDDHAIACGIVSDSCDRSGRPYVLLIMGTGKLTGWRRCWQYLPMGLAPTWQRMEQLSTSRAERFDQLEGALNRFIPPDPDWPCLIGESSITNDNTNESLLETKRIFSNNPEKADLKTNETHQIVALSGDSIEAALQWHRRAAAQDQRIPNSLFMGGPVTKPYLAVYYRALSPSDFVRLWTLGPKNDFEGN